MFKKIVFTSVVSLSVLSIAGCSSYDVRNFNPDVVASHNVAMHVHKNIAVGSFTMPGGKDSNKMMCRMAGNVYLPNKMTYSQYIQHAFESQLIAANHYSDNSKVADHTLTGDITVAQFSSVSGKWTISGNVSVDQKSIVNITSVTDFGTSFIADSACKDVADGFETATQNFVAKVLNTPAIFKALN